MAIKQVIVLRRRYPDGKGQFFGARFGKLVAQAAHASMKVFLDRMERGEVWTLRDITPAMRAWLEGSFTKVVLEAADEAELRQLEEQARQAGLPCALITDNGWTEFKGVPTVTALAIGPAESEEIDPITGRLKLL